MKCWISRRALCSRSQSGDRSPFGRERNGRDHDFPVIDPGRNRSAHHQGDFGKPQMAKQRRLGKRVQYILFLKSHPAIASETIPIAAIGHNCPIRSWMGVPCRKTPRKKTRK